MDNLINAYNLNKIDNNFVKWYRYGFMTIYGIAFDIGNSIMRIVMLAIHLNIQ